MGSVDQPITPMSVRRREFLGAFALAASGSAGCTTRGDDPSGESTPDESGSTPEGGSPTGDCEPPERSRDSTLLGDFETGLDGWRTNNGNELSRVTEDDVPMGVESGEHALAVKVRGAEPPTIENEERVRRADFANNPYLQLHVHAVDVGTDADLLFRFRLHYGDDCGSGGVGSSAPDTNVKESEDITVPQLYPRRMQWDMSDLPEDVLATANRLEVTWRPEDGESTADALPTAEGVDFRQLVVLDDVRLSADEPISDAERLQRKRMDLNREHGMIVERVPEVQNDTVERGTIEYADGYRTEYAFEELDDGGYRYTLDGETFVIRNRSERRSSLS